MRLDFAGKQPLLPCFLCNPPFTAIKFHQDGAGLPFSSHTFPADKSDGKEVSYSVPLLMPAHVQGQPDRTAICSHVPARTQSGLAVSETSELDSNSSTQRRLAFE